MDVEPSTTPIEKHIVIKCKEGDKINFPTRFVKYCKLLETMTGGFERETDGDSDSDSDSDFENEDHEIPLDQVGKQEINRICEFLSMHERKQLGLIPVPLPSCDLPDIISPPEFGTWISAFNSNDTCDLILAAQYIDIQPLLLLSCARLSTFIKGKTPEEIRKEFRCCETGDLNALVSESEKKEIASSNGVNLNDMEL